MNENFANSTGQSHRYFYGINNSSSYNINSPTLLISSSLINDEQLSLFNEKTKSADFTGYMLDKEAMNSTGFSTNLPQSNISEIPIFFRHSNRINIPSKIVFTLGRHIPKKLLKEVNEDIEIAKELCLLFTSLFTSTYFELEKDENADVWKSLKAEYLRDFLSNSYKQVIEALKFPLVKGPIIECDYKYIKDVKCYHYKLGDTFIGKGIVSYELKTDKAINLLNKHYQRLYREALKNPICSNLVQFYNKLSLLSVEVMLQEGKKLIKDGSKSKKGKQYAFINKHKKDRAKYSYIEEGIRRFSNLTDNGFMIPRAGNKASGGRVIDSIVLMNSWTRNLITVDGEPITECDYSCLHPNIAMHLYGGTAEYITHDKIAESTGISPEIVKKEHLSFFNKHPNEMIKSPLYDYYIMTQPLMIERIIHEKKRFGHRITSQRMFEIEVQIMTEIIKRLNQRDMYVGYGYDALFSSKREAKQVTDMMNAVILEFGIKTRAKTSDEKKLSPISKYIPGENLDINYVNAA